MTERMISDKELQKIERKYFRVLHNAQQGEVMCARRAFAKLSRYFLYKFRTVTPSLLAVRRMIALCLSDVFRESSLKDDPYIRCRIYEVMQELARIRVDASIPALENSEAAKFFREHSRVIEIMYSTYDIIHDPPTRSYVQVKVGNELVDVEKYTFLVSMYGKYPTKA